MPGGVGGAAPRGVPLSRSRSIGRPRRDWRRAGPGLASLRGCRPALGCSCRLRRAGLRGAVRPSHRATLQLDTVCVVEQAVADGVGLVGVADDGVPVGDGQLTGDEGRGAFGPVLDDLGEVAPLGVAQRCDHPIVDGEQVELREASQEPGVGAVAAADGEFVQQSWHADVACGEAAATGPFDERATEEALSDPGRADQDQVVAFGDPRAGAQRQDLLAVEPAWMGEVDGLEGGRMAQLGGAEPSLQLALLAGRPLGVDEQAEALLEAERGGLVGLESGCWQASAIAPSFMALSLSSVCSISIGPPRVVVVA